MLPPSWLPFPALLLSYSAFGREPSRLPCGTLDKEKNKMGLRKDEPHAERCRPCLTFPRFNTGRFDADLRKSGGSLRLRAPALASPSAAQSLPEEAQQKPSPNPVLTRSGHYFGRRAAHPPARPPFLAGRAHASSPPFTSQYRQRARNFIKS